MCTSTQGKDPFFPCVVMLILLWCMRLFNYVIMSGCSPWKHNVQTSFLCFLHRLWCCWCKHGLTHKIFCILVGVMPKHLHFFFIFDRRFSDLPLVLLLTSVRWVLCGQHTRHTKATLVGGKLYTTICDGRQENHLRAVSRWHPKWYVAHQRRGSSRWKPCSGREGGHSGPRGLGKKIGFHSVLRWLCCRSWQCVAFSLLMFQ